MTRSLQHDTVAQAWRAAELRWLGEALAQNATVRLDDTLRRDVLGIGGDLHERQAFSPGGWQQLPQCRRGIATATLPRNHGIADVAQAVWRQFVSSSLPAKPDKATELAIPKPPPIAR